MRGTRPPRGWNSYDAYAVHLHEEAALANLEILAERLAPSGYDHFVIDGGWYNEYERVPGSLAPARAEAIGTRLDPFGRYLPSLTSFPHGLVPIIDRAHALGLRAGLHIMRGIPREAVRRDLPVAGTTVTASEIVDVTSVCVWGSTANYGLDLSRPESRTYYDGWIGLLADWGVDFIKADDITDHPGEIEAVADAVARAAERCGRPIELNLSPGDNVDPRSVDVYARAGSVRVSRDVWDDPRDIDAAFEAWHAWHAVSGADRFWIDLDMLPFGSLLVPFGQQFAGQDSAVHGRGAARVSRLSAAQQRTVLAMRALACSPLFLGADLPTTDDAVFALVTTPEILACHDNGIPATPVRVDGPVELWQTATADGRTVWLGIFNRGDRDATVPTPSGTPESVVDGWTGEQRPVGAEIAVAAGDVAFLRYKADNP